jgi:hypothetical protein
MSTAATLPTTVTSSNIWMELAIVGVPKLIDVVLALVAMHEATPAITPEQIMAAVQDLVNQSNPEQVAILTKMAAFQAAHPELVAQATAPTAAAAPAINPLAAFLSAARATSTTSPR